MLRPLQIDLTYASARVAVEAGSDDFVRIGAYVEFGIGDFNVAGKITGYDVYQNKDRLVVTMDIKLCEREKRVFRLRHKTRMNWIQEGV